jgi:hypothetical protein
LGEAERALADFDRALQLDPKIASALFGRSLAKRQMGDGMGAEGDAATAREIDARVETRLRKEDMIP